MPFVETLESYSRALYLPLRGYVRRPFQFITNSIRDHVPSMNLLDMRKTLMEHATGGGAAGAGGGPFDGLGFLSSLGSSFGSSNNQHISMDHGGSTAAAVSRIAHGGGSAPHSSGSVASSGGRSIVTGASGAGGAGAKLVQSQPSMIHFFTSPYFLVLCFMSIVMNRINAIVAPRNPHPLKLSIRFGLKLPAFFLLMKSALITIALLIHLDHQQHDNQLSSPLSWLVSELRITYTESHALWLSYIAMGVSCTVDSFIANLHSTGTSEQTINMLEWAILFHFTPSGRDILIISVIQVCQLLTLQFLSLSSRGKNYRLIATTFWGMLDLIHFGHAVYHRSTHYPSLQLLTRLPEVVVILMVCISMTLHALTYIVTGGNVRRQMFDPRAMPTMDEEYGLAVFKLGRACMEATRGVGFRNEVDAIVLPFGTILDRKHKDKSRSSSHASSADATQTRRGVSFSFTSGPSGNRFSVTAPSGFSNEMTDVVETPGQRQRISRRRNRLNVMKAFCQSSASLMLEMTLGAYNRVVPARYRRNIRGSGSRASEQGTRMSVHDYIQLRTTIENALERARHSRDLKLRKYEAERHRRAAALDEEEEEELYSEFLSRDLTVSDDEDEDFDVDYMVQDESEEEEEDEVEDMETNGASSHSMEKTTTEEQRESYGIQRHSLYDDEETLMDFDLDHSGTEERQEQVSTWRSLGSLQDFFLDTSFMSIFLSGRLQDAPLTRSQYRLAMSGAREFQQHEDSIEYEGGEDSGSSSGGQLSRRKRTTTEEADKKTLLAILQRYRKTIAPSSPNVGTVGSSNDNMSPPPLAKPSAAPEDSFVHSRLLCVVCQSEPRGVILRPCRCLALCNECREVLASRRFKQCPCCRSDVLGFSKVYIP